MDWYSCKYKKEIWVHPSKKSVKRLRYILSDIHEFEETARADARGIREMGGKAKVIYDKKCKIWLTYGRE